MSFYGPPSVFTVRSRLLWPEVLSVRIVQGSYVRMSIRKLHHTSHFSPKRVGSHPTSDHIMTFAPHATLACPERQTNTESDNSVLCTIMITNMQNLLEHHLISTKLRCALPKCPLVQNYIVNRDLHVRCQPQKYYRYYTSMPLCTTCVCPLSIYLEKVVVLGMGVGLLSLHGHGPQTDPLPN